MPRPDKMGVMPYDPLHLYDVPDVLAAQIVDGETTWRGLKNLFLSPTG